jgi:hypothetical protein
MINDFFYEIQCRTEIFIEGDGDKQNIGIVFLGIQARRLWELRVTN